MIDRETLTGRSVGAYSITGTLGHGGFADVYLAENNATGAKVVIKMAASHYWTEYPESIYIPQNAGAIELGYLLAPYQNPYLSYAAPHQVKLDPWEINELLEREGEALEKITQPSFVKVLDKGAYYGLFYLVLEYIAGETLGEKIWRGDFIPLQYFLDIIDALIAAKEEGLDYHGDIKPANIIIKPDGSIKIVDPSSTGLKDRQSLVITTPLYNPFLTKDDINSLGVLLYEISVGFLPFRNSILDFSLVSVLCSYECRKELIDTLASGFISPIYLNPEMPIEINDIVVRALNLFYDAENGIYKYGGGYHSLLELREDIANCLQKGIAGLKMPRRGKTDAIIHALSPYLKKNVRRSLLEKVIAYIVNYSSPSLITTLLIKKQKDVKDSEHDKFKIGDKLLGKYEIMKIMQRGAAIDYAAYDSRKKIPVIIKTINPTLKYKKECADEFEKSAKIWLSIPEHKNIIHAYSLKEIDGCPHLFLEYIEGTDLWQLMRSGSVATSYALDIAIQICEAMEHIFNSRRIVHRDIKPSNIFVAKDGVAKLGGFDIALVIDPEDKKEKLEICGTVPYMSPEQWTGLSSLDNRADIYSFGCVLYETLTGKLPFYPNNIDEFRQMHLNQIPRGLREINPLIPEAFEAAVMKCLQKKPKDRYQSFGELREELVKIRPTLNEVIRGT